MKKLTNYIIIVILGIAYLVLGKIFNTYIPCPIRYILGLYCPGCGVTRMCYALLKLDFYQAYRYNQLVFITLPFSITLILNYIYASIKNKEPWYKKIPLTIWCVIIGIMILYGILRNIFPYLAPTKI